MGLNRREFLRTSAIGAGAMLAPRLVSGADTRPGVSGRPNVILIVTDDQGYAEMSCHGNPILKTPNLDKLHAQSVRLANYHVSPTCCPRWPNCAAASCQAASSSTAAASCRS
jgi:hypothetical protein